MKLPPENWVFVFWSYRDAASAARPCRYTILPRRALRSRHEAITQAFAWWFAARGRHFERFFRGATLHPADHTG